MHRILATGRRASVIAPSRQAAGFTLLELMVVMAILVLMASAVPISINRMMPGRRVAVVTERVSTAIRDAQAQSAASGSPIRLEVGQSELTSLQSSRAGATGVKQRLVTTATSTTLSAKSFDGRLIPAVMVFPDGATSGGVISIVDGVHRAQVSISALTGRVITQRDH